MKQENGLNHYQRFAGTSLEVDRLGRLPIRRCQFLGFAIGDDGVNIVEAPVHAVHLELDAKFSHAVPLEGFVLLVVEIIVIVFTSSFCKNCFYYNIFSKL